MKQTADDNQYVPRLKIVDTPQGDRMIIVSSPWGYRRMAARCSYDFMSPTWASCGDLAGTLRLSQEFGQNDSKIVRCPHDHRAGPVGGLCHATAMCLRAYNFFFSNLSLCGIKQNRRGHDARKSVR